MKRYGKMLIRAKSTFHWQNSDQGCGLACLVSVLAFCGMKVLPEVVEDLTAKGDEVSLFDLKEAGKAHGLTCKCVKMDFDTLNQLTRPCILHTVNERGLGHFIVSYGKAKGGQQILIGDPAFDLTYINEETLQKSWQSGAALFFEKLPKSFRFKFPQRLLKLAVAILPKELWIAMPALAIVIILITGLLSVAFQHLLTNGQSSTNDTLGSFGILLIATCFLRFILSFLQSRVMIETNAILNMEIANKILRTGQEPEMSVQNISLSSSLFSDIQRIRASILSITTLFSDLLVVILIQIVMIFVMPAAVLIGFLYLFACIAISLIWLPHLSILQTTIEQKVNQLTRQFSLSHWMGHFGHEIFPGYIALAKNGASLSNKVQLILNINGVIFLTVLLFIVTKNYSRQLQDSSHAVYVLLLALYLISIIPRLFINVVTISDGEDVCRRLNQRI